MPVPKSTVENSPRKLLRDVVLEKMLAAIQDGTLQPGERLNDDELVQWLGVSRTPIREAIAKLVDYGLVEMEANRYTRVATPTAEQFDDALQVFAGFAELATRWALPKLDDAQAAELIDILEQVREHAEHEDRAMNADVQHFVEAAIRAADNPLLSTLSNSVIPRVQFVALAEDRFTFWDGRFSVDPLIAAIRKRDGDAGGAVIRTLGVTLSDLLQRLRASQ
ncbi:GntR family transcriptional regulator [Curtobacterium sp. AB451]|uniref:GntR family transcriptional regulator n=1 Tax=unclassified Curtobacterium TaxID=257496 RepID=UPI00034C2B58|nr:GntR family transcriptional regulator [Curtobacterium sp. B18]